MSPDLIQQRLQAGLPNAVISVNSEDNIHFTAVVIDPGFRGLSRLSQHRMVYAVLEADLQENIHALQLTTQTPEEAK